MTIEVMHVYEWLGRTSRVTEVEQPSWDSVEAAIKSLNNANLNDLYLLPSASDLETYLCVGGGSGRYVMTGAIAGERFPTAVDPSTPSEPREHLVVGGQLSDFPHNWILDLDTVLRLAQRFHATGQFDGESVWIDS